MASLAKTYTGDLSTAITTRVLSAYFDWEDKNYIAQGKKGGSNVSGTDPMVGGSGGGGGGRGPINPEIVNRTPFDGLVRRPTINNADKRQRGVVVQDRALGNFLVAVSLSLSSSINSLNQKADETTEGIEVAKDGIDKTYKKLEYSSDSLENKLDAIVEALRYSNTQEKVLADQREISAKQTEQKMATDMSTANRILMQDMDREEIRQMQQEDIAEDDRGAPELGPIPPQNTQQLNLPEFGEGGIASGPDSGYLAVLHGDEAVIPLDNNYTQRQPSAIGQKPIANMPMMAERGTDNADSMTPTFRPNVTMASAPSFSFNSGGGGGGSGMGQLLAKAIELPTKAAGLVTMGLMNKVLHTKGISSKVGGHLKALASPIAKAFGVPNMMGEDVVNDDESRQDYSSTGGGRRRREKGLFGRFKDWIMGTGGSTYGRGGSLYGRGGSTTYNRMSVNGTGGYGYGGYGTGGYGYGGRNMASLPPYQDGRTPTRLFYNSPYKSPEMFIKDKQTIEDAKERFKLFTGIDLATGDSQFFAKNVTYDNAFDYFQSPNYGLRTSDIAYNMSLEDEVSNMIDGAETPEQIVMNNSNVNKDSGQQVEYSAIAVRGNPLKDGTYISPFAV
tara:strand:- start:124 stop:1971 length:1848 start_codon:yes stop_codon:yes gene_type:complete